MYALLRARERCGPAALSLTGRVAQEWASSAARFCSASVLPGTDNVPEPSPFWEKKMFKRFEKMDYNKDGWVDESDFNSQFDAIIARNKYPQDAIDRLKAMYKKHYKRVWSFGVDNAARKVSRREFMRGYTHIIKDRGARRELRNTIAVLLGGAWDAFDAAYDGPDDGHMTREEFIEYQTCWNLTAEEATALFEAAAAAPDAERISREEYLIAAWDFYFGMDERSAGAGALFWGFVKTPRPTHLTF